MNYDIINFLKFESIRNRIDSISTTSEDGIVFVHLSLVDIHPYCPSCYSNLAYKHGFVIKKITHSTLNHSKCIILFKAKRYKCKLCNKTFLEHNPFSSKGDSISTYTKLEVLNKLRNHNQTFSSVANLFNVSIQTVSDIFDKHVDCNKLPLPEVLCIDEVFTAKISSYKYACVMLDFNSNQIIDIIPTRHKNYLRYYLSSIQRNSLDNVKYVVMDMYEPYKDTILNLIPTAKIAIDSFHVIRQLNEAIKRIRIDIMNKYKNDKSFDHNDNWYYMLKKFHYFFVKDFGNIYGGLINIPKFKSKWTKYEIRDYLLSIDDDLKYAYDLKEDYRYFNRVASIKNDNDLFIVTEELDELIYRFRNSKLESFRTFGKLLNNWKPYIINSFYYINKRRLSNGPIEGMNSKIKTIIKVSNGMRNFKRFRNRCMFSLNKNTPVK